MSKRIWAFILAVVMVITMGCGTRDAGDKGNEGNEGKNQSKTNAFSAAGTDLVSEIQPRSAEEINKEKTETYKEHSGGLNDFTVNILKECDSGDKGILVSPLSIIYALGMTANGAKGETLKQMEDVLGISISDLNYFAYDVKNGISNNEDCKINLANSIWLLDDEKLVIEKDFLQNCRDYYGASVFREPFDENTLSLVNKWVDENTGHMIDKIIDRFPDKTRACLINALYFDAKWQSVYNENDVITGEFTTADGKKKETEFMFSEESQYISDDKSQGFFKPYKGGKYAFVGILPNEGVSLEEYISGLTGDKISKMLSNPEEAVVYASVPKFEMDYSTELSKMLVDLGMVNAFSSEENVADFSGMGHYDGHNLYISEAIHKTKIKVDEEGTKAGAATAIIMENAGAAYIEDFKTVYLDRPFMYGIWDYETKTFLFVGTMTDVE